MSPSGRTETRKAWLLGLGFQDPEASAADLVRIGNPARPLVKMIAKSADPDHSLCTLADLADRIGERHGTDERAAFLTEIADDEGTAMRLVMVLGASVALGEHLMRHPEHWRELTDPHLGSTRPAAYWIRAGLLRAVGADPDDARPVASLPDATAVDALRVEYRRVLLRLAARDLAHDVAVDDIAAELSDLAAGTLDAALAVARSRVGAPALTCRLAVVAMGKCGGHELELRQRRGRDLRGRGRRGRGRAAGPPGGHPARLPPDAGLLRPHR